MIRQRQGWQRKFVFWQGEWYVNSGVLSTPELLLHQLNRTDLTDSETALTLGFSHLTKTG